MGGRIMAAKGFPDLSGDGKITQKDILMGRGVIPREKKNKGGVARGCGAIMSNRRKKTKMYA
jgi:hypothetical protein